MSVLPVLLTVNTIVYPLSHSQVALPPVTELIDASSANTFVAATIATATIP